MGKNQHTSAIPATGTPFKAGAFLGLAKQRGLNRARIARFRCAHCARVGRCRLSRLVSERQTSCGCQSRRAYRENIEGSLDRLNARDRKELLRRLRVDGEDRSSVQAAYHLTEHQLSTLLRLIVTELEALPDRDKSAIAVAIVTEGTDPLAIARAYRLSEAEILIIASRQKRLVHRGLSAMKTVAAKALRAVNSPFVDRRGRTRDRQSGELVKAELTVSADRKKARGRFAKLFNFIRQHHQLLHDRDKTLFQGFIDLVQRTVRGRQTRSRKFLDRNLHRLRSRQQQMRDAAIDRAWDASELVAA